MTLSKEEIKEVAVQLANVAIVNYNDQSLTGEEREHKVIEFLVKLDDNIPMVNFIPNALEAQIAEIGVDKLQEFYGEDIQPFVKKCFGRIKHILHIG